MEKGKKCAPITRGAAMSFGFKKATPSPVHSTTNTNLPSVAANVTRETIEPLVIAPVEPRNGTPKLPRAKKDGLTKTPNRFGFRPIVPLSNKVADLNGKDTDIREAPRPHSSQALKLSRPRSCSETRYQQPAVQEARPESVQGKYTNLPRPQLPVRSAPSNDKWAKTMANRQTATKPRQQNSSMSSLFSNSDSGISSQKTNKEVEPFEIQQLDHSPAMANKFRNSKEVSKGPLARPTDMVLPERRTKRFDMRDLVGDVAGSGASESIRRSQGATASVHTSAQDRREAFSSPATSTHRLTFSSDSDAADEGYDEASTEEKQFRDKEATEKDEMVCGGAGESPIDEMWGRGEAMALEDEVAATISQVDQSPSLMHQPLRSVLLKIEDPTFASLAAMSHSTLLEDEVGPETPNLSSSPPSSMEPLPPPPNLGKEGCPESPDTPTHASNSLSSDTRERDFLIDDEIADQPGLVFDEARGNGTGTNEMSVTDTSKTIAKIAGEVSRVLASMSPRMAKKHGELGSTTSMSTLSPCESLASDDLMIDNDRSDASMFDDMNDLDDAALISEVETQRGQVMKEWNSILSSHPGLSRAPDLRGPRGGIRSRIQSTSSTGQESPRSRSNFSSPLRNIRHETSSGEISRGESDDSGIKVDRDTYQQMFQDVIHIKTNLLKLKRVLQESETLNPFDDKLKSGLYLGLASVEAGEESPHQLADIRRQVVFLQNQVEERDRKIMELEEALKRANESRPVLPQQETSKVNAATQTDKICYVRPLTTHPSLLQTMNDNSNSPFISNTTKGLSSKGK